MQWSCARLSLQPLLFLIVCAVPQGIAAQTAAKPQPVRVAEVQRIAFGDPIEALGTLRANESITLTANVTETVSVLHFDDGERVTRGQLLVEMTSAEEQALLAEARARLAEANRQFDRVRPLVQKGSASESLLDERRRDRDAAKAALVAIESRLADRVLRAPFAGVLGLRAISPGALVEPGDVITTLDDDSVMKLDFAVPSLFLQDLVPGLQILARARAYGDQVFTGEVRSIDSRVDPVTRTVQVRALLPNPERRLKPGVLMRIELQRRPRQALVVPEEALLHEGDGHHLYVVDAEGRAERRQVVLGSRRPGLAEVLSGVRLGEQVVTHGNDRLRPGRPLTVQAVSGQGATP